MSSCILYMIAVKNNKGRKIVSRNQEALLPSHTQKKKKEKKSERKEQWGFALFFVALFD